MNPSLQSRFISSRFTNFLLLSSMLLGSVVVSSQSAIAATWVKVTANAAKDGFFIDTDSIQKKGQTVTYWEYREFSEPNNAFLENDVPKPLYGVVIRWSGDCNAKTQRLRRVNAFTSNRVLIQKFDYGDKGTLTQPRPGSSGYEVLEMACNPQKLDQPKTPSASIK